MDIVDNNVDTDTTVDLNKLMDSLSIKEQKEYEIERVENDTVNTEKDRIRNENDTVNTEKDRIRNENDTVNTEKDRIRNEKNIVKEMTKERNKEEKCRVKAEKERAKAEKIATQELEKERIKAEKIATKELEKERIKAEKIATKEMKLVEKNTAKELKNAEKNAGKKKYTNKNTIKATNAGTINNMTQNGNEVKLKGRPRIEYNVSIVEEINDEEPIVYEFLEVEEYCREVIVNDVKYYQDRKGVNYDYETHEEV